MPMTEEEKLEKRRAREPLLEFLKRGGVLLREDYGGAVGVRWGRAHRNGPAFDRDECEDILNRGVRLLGKKQRLAPVAGTDGAFAMQEVTDEQA